MFASGPWLAEPFRNSFLFREVRSEFYLQNINKRIPPSAVKDYDSIEGIAIYVV